MKCVHVYYFGHVQGVGFRYTAIDCARKYPITGYVKNLPDGRVEIVAEADQATLHQFLDQIRQQMSKYITEEKFQWEPATANFSNFRINH